MVVKSSIVGIKGLEDISQVGISDGEVAVSTLYNVRDTLDGNYCRIDVVVTNRKI